MRKKWTHFQQKLRFFLYRTTLSIPESSRRSLSPGPYYYQRCGTSVSSPARKFEVSENSARELTLISTRQLTITDLLLARVAQGPQGIKIFRSH